MKCLLLGALLFTQGPITVMNEDTKAIVLIPSEETMKSMDLYCRQFAGFDAFRQVCEDAYLEGGRAAVRRLNLAAKRVAIEK